VGKRGEGGGIPSSRSSSDSRGECRPSTLLGGETEWYEGDGVGSMPAVEVPAVEVDEYASSDEGDGGLSVSG
jgi:hypothetical protein